MNNLKFYPSKKMGQNFLINDEVVERIVNLIDYKNYDCVIEIGPGKGALTKFIIKEKVDVIAIELDKRLAEHIGTQYPSVKLINDDVLNVDLDKICKQYNKPILLSNLPYSISSPFLFKYLHLHSKCPFVCMLQKEFVDRLVAKPNSKSYGSLSVVCHIFFNIKEMLSVSKSNFEPRPDIDSVVVLITKKYLLTNIKMMNFIRMCFMAKRKTLLNNLKGHFPKEQIKNAISQLKLNETIRAEAISPEKFIQLFNLLNHEN